jgi:hypothetical protein
MTVRIRAAETLDVPAIVDLLMEDAVQRQASNPVLWAVAGAAAREKVADALVVALEADDQPFRQKWLVAEAGTEIVAVTHSMLLPVPRIYAGRWGDPGLLLEDCALAAATPPGTADALLDAAEADLRAAGARLLLASSVPGGRWQATYERHGYADLTLYLTKDLRGGAVRPREIRPAAGHDIPNIVERSAENRKALAAIDEFWTPHSDADTRFGSWMKRSLTLGDRDMLLAGPADALDGYVIAQPASRLHFPSAHDIAGIGVIDDYFHADYADPSVLRNGGKGAAMLLHAAEAALAVRGFASVLVVCPSAWTSKISVLEGEGYETAMVWMIRRQAPG